MADDRRAKPEAGPAAPKRSGARTAPVIDAKATDVTPADSEAQSIAAGPLPGAEPEPEQPVATAAPEPLPQEAGDGGSSEPPPDSSATETAASPPPEARGEPMRPRHSGGALAGLALAVSVLALAAAAALGWQSFNTGDPTAALSKRLDAVEGQVADLRAQSKTIGGLDQRLKALEADARSGSSRLDQLRADVAKAVTTAEAARLASAQPAAKPTPEPQPSPAPNLAPLQARIAALENQARTTGDLTGRLDAMDKRIARLEQQIAAQGRNLDALAARPKLDVAATERATKAAVTTADTAASLVVAQNLVRAVESGRPFEPELAALGATGADRNALAALQGPAKTGVPTAAELASSFQPLAGPILAGTTAADKGGIWDRLTRSAGRLVKIRPAGDASGTGTPALVARIEGALARGDVAAALAERDKLPEAARQRTADWAARAKTRVEALAAAQGILSAATQRLGQPRS